MSKLRVLLLGPDCNPEQVSIPFVTYILKELASNRELINHLRQRGVAYARERLAWDAKARMTSQVLNWVVGRARKPHLLAPKNLRLQDSVHIGTGGQKLQVNLDAEQRKIKETI